MSNGIAEGQFGEMIIVMPDQLTKWFGSFYSNSTVTGNWEDFTTTERVKYIDSKYRTLATPASRGIAGHSMGGYGAIKIGMKYPEIYGVVYGMNPALLGWSKDFSIENRAFARAINATSFDQLMQLFSKGDFYPAAIVTVAQAFSPNPARPPFYVDFPLCWSMKSYSPQSRSLANGREPPDHVDREI